MTSGNRGNLLGFEVAGGTSSKDMRRIGKVRMTWEESVSLWGEEGDNSNNNNRGGRIKVEGSSFLNADELTFFDESMVACTMESFEDGPLKGFSVDRFLSGQQVKVVGRRKSSSTSVSSGTIIFFVLTSICIIFSLNTVFSISYQV